MYDYYFHEGLIGNFCECRIQEFYQKQVESIRQVAF